MYEWGEDLISWFLRERLFIKIKRNEAWAHCISKYSVLMHSKLHLLEEGDRASKAPLHQQVQWILIESNSVLCFQLVKKHWMFGAKFLFHECVDFDVFTQDTHDCDLNPARTVQLSVKWGWRGERCILGFEVSASFLSIFPDVLHTISGKERRDFSTNIHKKVTGIFTSFPCSFSSKKILDSFY